MCSTLQFPWMYSRDLSFFRNGFSAVMSSSWNLTHKIHTCMNQMVWKNMPASFFFLFNYMCGSQTILFTQHITNSTRVSEQVNNVSHTVSPGLWVWFYNAIVISENNQIVCLNITVLITKIQQYDHILLLCECCCIKYIKHYIKPAFPQTELNGGTAVGLRVMKS